MRYLYILLLSFSLSFASLDSIDSFDAEFVQSVSDDRGKTLTYRGHVSASKPQNALWRYLDPIKKDVFVNSHKITIVESEIEQVIIRDIDPSLDFFNMIRDAKEIKKGIYRAVFGNKVFTITTKEDLIETISYMDEFENSVKIKFHKQKQNIEIEDENFKPNYPLGFDIIRD